ncbi:IMP dehydrogenase [Candidatus Woesearchaeota archaeon]|jgi:IMP dehydrogenase|nr:IMP dehydrogenase [Candidatus Woesearchaeota archaeon]MBT4732612.1 IMP dehydrogenase [Candidatus Woesearchaeota archaeon]MBT7557464.1 IMP dehydrogenase [Candidatus Woesearchaeota archaeon]
MKKALTYDDIGIVPKYSEILSRSDINLTTRFTKNTEITIPVVSSPMDTVTGYEMALEMMDWGGVGVLHRFNTIEEQARMMNELHTEWDKFFGIGKDFSSYEETWEKWNSKFNGNLLSSQLTPNKDDWDDLKEDMSFVDEMETMNKRWRRKPLCAAIGVTGDYLERAQELVANGCNVLLIDVAHGHHKLVKDTIRELKNGLRGDVEIIGGSIATGTAAKDLCEWGVDGLRVGIGGGSVCSTRIQTGVGVPNITSIQDCCIIADTYNVPVITDGGIGYIADICKSIGIGADSVMLGSLLSGTKETPGEIHKDGLWPNERLYKKYSGSASLENKLKRNESKNVEGYSFRVEYKGKTKRILNDISDGLRSSMSYVGASNIEEFQTKCEFVEVTNAGIIEAKPHLMN